MRIDLVKARTWLRSLNTAAKCCTILLCHISPFRISHLPNPPPPRRYIHPCPCVCLSSIPGPGWKGRWGRTCLRHIFGGFLQRVHGGHALEVRGPQRIHRRAAVVPGRRDGEGDRGPADAVRPGPARGAADGGGHVGVAALWRTHGAHRRDGRTCGAARARPGGILGADPTPRGHGAGTARARHPTARQRSGDHP